MVSPAPRPQPLGRVRLATVEDAPNILDLINESIAATFRVECTNDIMYLIENSILSICQLDAFEGIVGFVAVKDYPLLPSVHPSTWESYIWIKYKATEMNARNTLFLHLLCWDPSYQREAVDNILKSIFMHDAYVHHIAMIKSVSEYPLLVPGQSRSEASFRRVVAVERGCNAEILPVLYVADRTEVSPRLRVRRAVEADNDDLIPIIENHSTVLRELYGDFYISELISRHPESDRVLLVCEHKELAIGVMCLNTTINYEALEESFILEPFGGLRHLEIEAEVAKVDEPEVSDTSVLVVPHYTNSMLDPNNKEQDSLNSDDDDEQMKLSPNSEDVMAILLEDEDSELEFDIININTEDLRVPEPLYCALSMDPIADETTLYNIKMHLEDKKKKNKKEKAHKITARSSSTSKPWELIRRYKGAPNAFVIELFAIDPEYDERYGFDILEVAYELFPNRDYCIICLPSQQLPFPLLEHFTLVTPIGSRMRFINESLYVAHINSIRGNLRVRLGEKCDVGALDSILANSLRMDTLKSLYESSLQSNSLESFVFLSENQPIGMLIIGPLEDGTTIRTHYDLEPEPRRPGTDGAILAGIMSPALEPHTRWYLREILRQSRYSTLFWTCRLFAKGDVSPLRNLMSFAGHMSPVHPRISVPNISGNKDLDKIYKQIVYPFSLWMVEKPLTSIPKIYVNNSIVVVGASRTGLSFLETLLMGPTSQYLTFSNITLVSTHGLHVVADCLKAAEICVPRHGRFTDRYIKSIPFYYYLDVISATMVGIDRQRKCIQLKDGSTKYYDELVLTCGEQFQHPQYLQDAFKLDKEVQKGKPCVRLLMDNPKHKEDRVPPPPDLPGNVYLINSLYDANINLRKLMHMINDLKDHETYGLNENNQIVVYGDCIEAYTCIAALLELGIQSKYIVFVEPFPSREDSAALRVNCFNDETVDERVQAKLPKQGVSVIRQCHLDGWKLIGKFVESLNLMTPLHAISLNCFALFYYGRQAIDLYAFKAINECGLVYDGGLVVSPTFETNDPFIYGAGTCVSYSRRLYATRRLHRNFCSEDIGEALARLFLQKLDPFDNGMGDQGLFSENQSPSYTSSVLLGYKNRGSVGSSNSSQFRHDSILAYRRWQPVLRFKSPTVQAATFPGPLYYMKVRKPGTEVPMAVQQILPHRGHTLTTDKNDNYFCVHLNAYHVVDHVTCLSNKPFSIDLLSQLYGKHEAFFNNLLARYLKNEITDFYEFFTQSWMAALYHETFKELINDINAQDLGTIYDLLKSRFTLYDEEGPRMESMMYRSRSSLVASVGSFVGLSYKDLRKLGTFRSVIEKHIAGISSADKDASFDIPRECGQDNCIHRMTMKFWDRVTGERIVSAHLANYLNRNSVTNPQYTMPKPDHY